MTMRELALAISALIEQYHIVTMSFIFTVIVFQTTLSFYRYIVKSLGEPPEKTYKSKKKSYHDAMAVYDQIMKPETPDLNKLSGVSLEKLQDGELPDNLFTRN